MSNKVFDATQTDFSVAGVLAATAPGPGSVMPFATLSSTLGVVDAWTKTQSDARYVPYTGATGPVNLGTQALTAGAITASGTIIAATKILFSGTNSTDCGIINALGTRLIWGRNSTSAALITQSLSENAGGSGFTFRRGEGLAWSGSTTSSEGGGQTAFFFSEAANTYNFRNGLNAQSIRVYNTYTSSTNYERAILDWKTTSNVLRFGTEKGSGGGSARDLVLVTDATDRLTVTSTGLIHSAKTIGQTTESSNTPSGTTQTVTLDNGNHQILNLSSSTGDVTVTLTIPSKSGAGSILVKQHGTTARNITWAASSGSVIWLGTQPTWSSDGTGKYRRVSWYYSPTESALILAASDSN